MSFLIRPATLIFLVFWFNGVLAQPFPDSTQIRWSVKLSPLAIFSGTVDVAMAYYPNPRYAIEVKVGSNLGKTSLGNLGAFKTLLELQRKVHPKVMMAFEFGFFTVQEGDSVKYYVPNGDGDLDLETVISDGFSFRLTRYSVTPKIIWIMHSGRHFQIEGFAGIGWKRVRRKVYQLEFDETLGHVDPTFYEGLFSEANYTNRSWTSARVALGINFCYLIYKSGPDRKH